MKSMAVYSLGGVPEFGLLPTDNGYFTERLHCEMSTMLYNAAAQGMLIQQPELSDYQDIVTLFGAWKTDLLAYLEDLIVWYNSGGDKPTVPEFSIAGQGGLLKEKSDLSRYLTVFVNLLSVMFVERTGLQHIVDLLNVLISQESILKIGDFEVWTKSAAVNANPNV